MVGDGWSVVAEIGEDMLPGDVDRIGIGQIAGIEVFNEDTVGTKQEGGFFYSSRHGLYAVPFKRFKRGRPVL